MRNGDAGKSGFLAKLGRVKRLMLQPKSEFEVISTERETLRGVFFRVGYFIRVNNDDRQCHQGVDFWHLLIRSRNHGRTDCRTQLPPQSRFAGVLFILVHAIRDGCGDQRSCGAFWRAARLCPGVQNGCILRHARVDHRHFRADMAPSRPSQDCAVSQRRIVCRRIMGSFSALLRATADDEGSAGPRMAVLSGRGRDYDRGVGSGACLYIRAHHAVGRSLVGSPISR